MRQQSVRLRTVPAVNRDVLRLSSSRQTLRNAYVGTTSDLIRRIWEDRNKVVPGFTKTYRIDRLVWFEAHESSESALRREKQIKECLIERSVSDFDEVTREPAKDHPAQERVKQSKACHSGALRTPGRPPWRAFRGEPETQEHGPAPIIL
jgi:predicted GIY-YIG superfamily endonuclease